MPKIAINRLKKVSLFKDLSSSELKELAPYVQEMNYKKGDIVWEEGSPEQGLHIIDTGKVRVTRMTREGCMQVLSVLKDNQFFGELSLLDGRSHSASVETLQKTRLFVIRKADMDKFLKERPQIAYKIVRDIAIAISELLRAMNDKFINIVGYIWE